MNNEVLYRKYRPNNFEELVGHNYFKSIIISEIKNKNLSHALLLNGQRGTGKTSAARLIAKSYICDNLIKGYEACDSCKSCKMFLNNSHPDIFEIDAASNNGVDEIRNIKENISSKPIVSNYKIYIIDEVHMLTNNAFNAFLKTLEEPPSFVIFILATTEIYLVPKTILSRCQLYNFNKLGYTEVSSKIKEICSLEGISISDEIIKEIYNNSEGSMRDALNILEQLRNLDLKEIKIQDYNKIFTFLTQYDIYNFIIIILIGDTKEIILKIYDYDKKGINFRNMIISLINFIKNYISYYFTNDKQFVETFSEEWLRELLNYDLNLIINLENSLINVYEEFKNSSILPTITLMNIVKEISLKNDIKENKHYNYSENKLEVKKININENKQELNHKTFNNKKNKSEIDLNKNNKTINSSSIVFKVDENLVFNILINRKNQYKNNFEKIINSYNFENFKEFNFLSKSRIIAATENAFIFIISKIDDEFIINYNDLLFKDDNKKALSVIFGKPVAMVQILHSEIDYYKSKIDVVKNNFKSFYVDLEKFFKGEYFYTENPHEENIKKLKSIFPKLEVK